MRAFVCVCVCVFARARACKEGKARGKALKEGGRGDTAHHDSLALPHAGVGRAVRPDEAIDVELCIIRPAAVPVPTVAPELHFPPILQFLLVDQALVHPVPDEAALHSQIQVSCDIQP